MSIEVKDENLQIERLSLKPFGTNTYVLTCLKTRASVLVDAPSEAMTIMHSLEGTKPQYILMTHSHMDHTMALEELRNKLGIPVAANRSDTEDLPVEPDLFLKDGDILDVGALSITVIHTPGHTPGSLCFKIGKYLISGDSLFDGGPGRTESPEDLRQIIKSLTTKLFTLPDDTQVFPGHGNSTVLKKEKDEYAVFAGKQHDPKLCGDIVWLKS